MESTRKPHPGPFPLESHLPEHDPTGVATRRAPLGDRLSTLIAITLPPAGVVGAAVLLWGNGFSWTDLWLLVGMYLLTGVGITIGFHRLFTHRSFRTHAWVEFILVALGSMAAQWPVLRWVAHHRRHHQHSDTPNDPHTPHHSGAGALGVLRGAWHAHVGWLFQADPPGLYDCVRDLERDRAVRVAGGMWPLWIVLGFAVPAAVGGLIAGNWAGALSGLVWGGLVRIFLVHHVTWSINSACHLWGRRPFACGDQSRNNAVFGVLAMGEGWHNAHHAFPTSARHGLQWWQLDGSFYLIRLMSWVGLAWNVRVPSAEAIARARRV